MSEPVLHFNPQGSPREVGCSAPGGAWTTALASVTCPVCKRLYAAAPGDAVAERRQRARESFDDEWSGAGHVAGGAVWAERLRLAREACVETATRVRITDEAIREFGIAWHGAPQDGPPGTRRTAALAAALRELGFEVEQ